MMILDSWTENGNVRVALRDAAEKGDYRGNGQCAISKTEHHLEIGCGQTTLTIRMTFAQLDQLAVKLGQLLTDLDPKAQALMERDATKPDDEQITLDPCEIEERSIALNEPLTEWRKAHAILSGGTSELGR